MFSGRGFSREAAQERNPGDPGWLARAAVGSAPRLPRRLEGSAGAFVPAQLNRRCALQTFPGSCAWGSGTVGLCANACACLSSLLSQLNCNSLHKACLSRMTLNIHRPVSCNNSKVEFKYSEVGAALSWRSRHRGWMCLMTGILLLTGAGAAVIEAPGGQATCQRLHSEGATPLTFDTTSLLFPGLLLIYTFILWYT